MTTTTTTTTTTTSISEIGPLLITSMAQHGVKQSELADLLKVTRPAVSQQLSRIAQDGGATMKVSTIVEYFGALGYDVEVTLIPQAGHRPLVTVEGGASFS